MATFNFKKGDFVVYPAHGVGEVIDLTKESFGDIDLELIVVRFDKNRMTLRIPYDKVEISGLRKISSKKDMEHIVEVVKDAPQVKRMMWSRRAQMYEDKINSGDTEQVAEVVRDLYRIENKEEQSFSERQIYQKALERLATEFAAVNKISEDDAVISIETAMDKSPAKKKAAKDASKGKSSDFSEADLDAVIAEAEGQ